MNAARTPFALALEAAAFLAFDGTEQIIRRLSDMAGLFSDKQAVERTLVNGDPLIYEFLEVEHHSSPGGLSFGITRIHPGKIGREYYMTKGHFHASEGDEIYVTLRGQGRLVLQTRDGESRTMEMQPGNMCYIASGWAHRTVNVGEENLVFLSLWPARIEHDYETIARNGFSKLVVATDQGPAVIENPTAPK